MGGCLPRGVCLGGIFVQGVSALGVSAQVGCLPCS